MTILDESRPAAEIPMLHQRYENEPPREMPASVVARQSDCGPGPGGDVSIVDQGTAMHQKFAEAGLAEHESPRASDASGTNQPMAIQLAHELRFLINLYDPSGADLHSTTRSPGQSQTNVQI